MKRFIFSILLFTATLISVNATKKQTQTVLFEVNSTQLSASSQEQLEQFFQDCQTQLVLEIKVFGFADPTGDQADNENLALRRAEAVEQFLSDKGIRSELISVQAGRRTARFEALSMEEQRCVKLQYIYEPKIKVSGEIDPFRLFKNPEEQFQTMVFDASKDAELYAEQGTLIHIPAGALVNKNGKVTKGQVTLTVGEFLDQDALLAHNLSTSSGDQVIESQGTIFLRATLNGEELSIAPGLTIDVSLPVKESKENMEVFLGQPNASGPMNWTVPQIPLPAIYAETEIDLDKLTAAYEESPNLKGEMKKWANEIKIRDNYREIAALVGYATINYREKAVERIIDEYHIEYLAIGKQMYNNMPGFGSAPRHIPLYRESTKRTLGLTELPISNYDLSQLDKIIFNYQNRGLDEVVFRDLKPKNTGPNYMPMPATNGTLYVQRTKMPIPQMGWINCDRFLSSGLALTNVKIETNIEGSYGAVMVFEKINSIMPLYQNNQGAYFPNIPVGEKVEIIAYTVKDDRVFIAKKKFQVKRGQTIPMILELDTTDSLSPELADNAKY